MKGNTSIEMNMATICEAVQEYLDARLVNDGSFGKVTFVKQTTGMEVMFRVDLQKDEAPTPA